MCDRGLADRLQPDEELQRVGIERCQPQRLQKVAEFRANQHLPIMIHIHGNAPMPVVQSRCAPTWLIKGEGGAADN